MIKYIFIEKGTNNSSNRLHQCLGKHVKDVEMEKDIIQIYTADNSKITDEILESYTCKHCGNITNYFVESYITKENLETEKIDACLICSEIINKLNSSDLNETLSEIEKLIKAGDKNN